MPMWSCPIISMRSFSWPTKKGRPSGSPLRQANLPTGPKPASLGSIVGQFKSQVTKRIIALWGPEKEPLWQRNYYEHVIRDEEDLNRIREYIPIQPDSLAGRRILCPIKFWCRVGFYRRGDPLGRPGSSITGLTSRSLFFSGSSIFSMWWTWRKTPGFRGESSP